MASIPIRFPKNSRQKKAGQFLLAFLATGLALHFFWEWKLASLGWPYDANFTTAWKNLDRRHPMPSDASTFKVLLLGSSRSLNGINGEIIEPILSQELRQKCWFHGFSIPGCGPSGQWVYLNRLLQKKVRPDAVVLEILPSGWGDHPKFPDGIPPERCTAEEIQILNGLGIGPSVKMASSSLPLWFDHRKSILLDWAPKLVGAGERAFPECLNPWGFGKMNLEQIGPEQRRKNVERSHADYFEKLSQIRFPGRGVNVVRATLDLCRKENIPVAFYVTPEGPEFQKWYVPGTREEFRYVLETVSREYNVPYFDLGNDWPEEDFADSHHCLPSGARKLSGRLAREHLAPWLKKLPSATPSPGMRYSETRGSNRQSPR